MKTGRRFAPEDGLRGRTTGRFDPERPDDFGRNHWTASAGTRGRIGRNAQVVDLDRNPWPVSAGTFGPERVASFSRKFHVTRQNCSFTTRPRSSSTVLPLGPRRGCPHQRRITRSTQWIAAAEPSGQCSSLTMDRYLGHIGGVLLINQG